MLKIDFSQPARQSNAAIFIIIYHLYKNWIKRLLPVLAGVLFGSGKTWVLLLTFGIFIVFVAILGIIYFYKYTFQIIDNELIIHKGVFKTTKLNIPFERIQSINFKQTILHQMLSVVELEVDTAGSSKIEFDLRAIPIQKANALRQIILESNPHIATEEEPTRPAPTEKKLFQLSFGELVKVGLTQNHIKSGLIPFALYFWLRDLLHSGGIELDELASEYAEPERIYQLSLFIIGMLVIIYALASMLISLIMSIIRFFDLSLYRQEDGFSVSYGLLTKRQITIKDEKIQIVKWEDNLLRKLPGIYNMQIKQAAAATVKQKNSSIFLAGIPQGRIRHFLDTYFKDVDYEMERYTSISQWWFIRRMVIITLLLLLTIGVATYYPFHPMFGIMIGGWLFLYLSSYLYFRKKRIGINDDVIHIKGGHFGDENELMQIYKIQGVQLSQSPFQRRKDLASIVLFTAAGNLNIPYIPLETARIIRDFVLKVVETDQRNWM